MRNLFSRLEKLEEHFSALSCTCKPLLVVSEAADHELTQAEIDAQIGSQPQCPVHAAPTGMLVIVRMFSVTQRA